MAESSSGRGSAEGAAVVTRVAASASGFDAFACGGAMPARVAWEEVERVFTYKLDCFTYDTIWLAFEVRGRESPLHVSEEAEGFDELLAATNRAFPSINPEWYFDVMTPAFAPNFTVLYERTPSAGGATADAGSEA